MTWGRSTSFILVGTSLALILSACGSDETTERASSVDGATVTVADYEFEPATLTVQAGDTVTWVWDGQAPHNVVGEGFQSSDQSAGSFRHTFERSGTYRYECTIHPGMEGTVVVRAGGSVDAT